MLRKIVIFCFGFGFLLELSATANDEFALGVRTTPHLSPAEEQKTFTLPPGFEIQLFAAEPDISKPLNMAFDNRGRLWITNTVEYPYAAPDDRPGRDSIRILEDTDGDGRADKISTFADELNIPIGLLPYQDGVIAFSIPNIWHLRDTDGDGKADVRTKLYGPFGVDRDTHGLNNAFRRNYDGWVYACHGFNNHTTVQGTDGHSITMQSGNTYRFRLDGSRIEQFTYGQVNPFGMAFDAQCDIFTADCHSKPVYQLLRAGYYPSFGRPHNGLGFVPPMMDHLHGSTAISGISVYEDDRFPEKWQGTVFSGNVMTSRINHNSLVRYGSTYRAKEEDDFLKTTDPWFRPVDIQLGPDGALYVADFYNRIIGHYEVPLDHEGRDRTSGRIWRIVRTDQNEPRPTDLTALPLRKLVTMLSSPNQTQRYQIINYLVDHADEKTAKLVSQFFNTTRSPEGRSCALWVLERLGQLDRMKLEKAAKNRLVLVRIHAMKILAERAPWSDGERQLAVEGLNDEDAFVRRAAVDGLSLHPSAKQTSTLLDMLLHVDSQDTHLKYALRQALLNSLQAEQGFQSIVLKDLDDTDRRNIASVLLASRTPQAASYLLSYLEKQSVDKKQLSKTLQHIARYLPSDDLPQLVQIVRRQVEKDIDLQAELLLAVASGQRQQGSPLDAEVRTWGQELVTRLLSSIHLEKPDWRHRKYENSPSNIPWGIRKVPIVNEHQKSKLIDSRPGGERATGIYRSPEFTIPARFTFYLAGHRGFPREEAHQLTRVELHEASTGKILATAYPPRNDTAQRIEWKLDEHAGRQGYLEIVDGDSAEAYAWLAVGRFDPAIVDLPNIDPAILIKRLEAVAQMATELQLKELRPQLIEILQKKSAPKSLLPIVAKTLASFNNDSRLSCLIPALVSEDTSEELQNRIVAAFIKEKSQELTDLLAAVVKTVPASVQSQMAEQLVLDRLGATTLLKLITAGQFSPRVLLQPQIKQALPAVLSAEQLSEVDKLTADIPDFSAELQTTIDLRLDNFPKSVTSVERGQAAFKKHCAVCHRIGSEGNLIGPQLDGIGNRGLARLLEDVIDPNRNVDAAFRSSTLVMDTGKVLTGLFRREEGAVLVFAGNDGKEFSVATEEIEQRIETPVSLMPAGFPAAIEEQEFYDLMAYLLTIRGK